MPKALEWLPLEAVEQSTHSLSQAGRDAKSLSKQGWKMVYSSQ